MSSETPHEDLEVSKKSIRDAASALRLAHDNWPHAVEFHRLRQDATIRTYLWLAVAFFTGLAALTNAPGFSFPALPTWAQVSLGISAGATSVHLLLGIICLSGMFFHMPPAPIIDMDVYCKALKDTEDYAPHRYILLSGMVSDIAVSKRRYAKSIEQKGRLLRTQCILALVAFLSAAPAACHILTRGTLL